MERAWKLRDNLHGTGDRQIVCKDCNTISTWDDAVKSGWVLGFQAGTYRCCACGNDFENSISKIIGR